MAAAATEAPDVFHMGAKTLRISRSELHHVIRQNLVQRANAALSECTPGVVVLKGGELMNEYATDTEMIFKQDAYFHYLFGVQEDGWYGALDLQTGKSLLFMPKLPDAYAVWMGRIKTPDFFQAKYAVDEVHYVDDISSVLKALQPPCLHVLKGINSDSGLEVQPATFPGIEHFTVETDTLFEVINECRVYKTPQEVAVLQYANQVAAAGHVACMQACKPGTMEYQLESLFLHHCYSQGGMRFASYGPIAASGADSGILHYVPNDKEIKDGTLVLSDMGCSYYGYISDITATYPASGKFSPDQAAVYEAVLAAHQRVIAEIKPGVAWPDMHRLANRIILEGLREMGVVKGDVDEMMEHHIGALFMPHGLGHFFGLNTHDVGGYPRGGPSRIMEPGLKSLRTARVLKEGMCITVEPGCYFIAPLLEPALSDPQHSPFLCSETITRLLNQQFGGVRIEDDVLVTASGSKSLTAGLVPRSVKDVEAVMAGAPWPPVS